MGDVLLYVGENLSYENEDVYKRQVGTLAKTAAENNITKTALMIIGDTVAAAHYDRSKLYDPESVSYTHLDVYKRQVVDKHRTYSVTENGVNSNPAAIPRKWKKADKAGQNAYLNYL